MVQKVHKRFHWKWFFTVILFIFFYLAGILTHHLGHTYQGCHEWLCVSGVICILVVVSLLRRREIILEKKAEEKENEEEKELCDVIQIKLMEIDRFITKALTFFNETPKKKLNFEFACVFEEKEDIIEVLDRIFSILVTLAKRIKRLDDLISAHKYEIDEKIKFLEQNVDISNELILKIASEIKDINRVVIAQQDDVVEYTEGAAAQIITNLNRIEESVNEVINIATRGMHELEVLFSKKTGSKAETVEELLLSLREHIQKQLNTISENIEKAVYVLNEARSLEGLIDEVKTIADKTKLLSLNAAIEAARAGEAGRGFGVVADEIHKLADLSHKTADKMNRMISNLIYSINQKFEDLMVIADSAKRKEGFEIIVSGINDLFKVNEEATRIRSEILNNMQQQAQAVVQTVIEVLGSIQFQDITRQRIENIQNFLKEINEYFNNLLKYLAENNIKEITTMSIPSCKDLEKNYKMNKERKIHKEVIKEENLEEEGYPSIELF